MTIINNMSASKDEPLISIPASSATSTVRVIDSTSTIHYPAHYFFTVPIASHSDLDGPSFSFLVSDSSGKRHVLFDLGIRKDWKTGLPKHFVEDLEKKGAYCEVEYDVAEILDKESSSLPKSKDIESIIWSHHHFDHTGNPNLFHSHVPILVGPGFKKAVLPGYPKDPSSSVTSSCWDDRTLKEVDFEKDERALQIGPFQAIDYFGDSTFYLISTPGHAPGHLSGLARVTPTTFVFMGADAAHHEGEFRPSQYLPLPKTVSLPSSKRFSASGCPGEILANLQPERKGSITTPFYEPSDDFCTDKEQAMDSIRGIIELDASSDTFVILAHDKSLRSKIPLFPESINDWKEKDLDAKTRWLFVDEFAASVDEAYSTNEVD